MKILDFLHKETIIVELKATNKKEVIEELTLPVSRFTKANHEELVRVLHERELLGSTGIGDGIGIPHGKLKGLASLILGVGLSQKGIDFDAMDNKPIHIFFLLLASDNSTGLHLKLLARISKILKDPSFKKNLLSSEAAQDVISIIQDVDEEF